MSLLGHREEKFMQNISGMKWKTAETFTIVFAINFSPLSRPPATGNRLFVLWFSLFLFLIMVDDEPYAVLIEFFCRVLCFLLGWHLLVVRSFICWLIFYLLFHFWSFILFCSVFRSHHYYAYDILAINKCAFLYPEYRSEYFFKISFEKPKIVDTGLWMWLSTSTYNASKTIQNHNRPFECKNIKSNDNDK